VPWQRVINNKGGISPRVSQASLSQPSSVAWR
jgi:alkylated DNA nucleotide flippase Atl1